LLAALIKIVPAPGTLRGMILMVLGGLSGQVMVVLVRQVSVELHPFEITLFRAVFGLLALSPLFARYGFARFRTKRLGLHALRGILNASVGLAFFMALTLISLAKVSALSFTAPLFTTVLAVLVMGETIRLRRIAALCVGFAGTWVILRPGFVDVEPGSLMVLAGSAGFAATMILAKMLTRTESSIAITLYSTLFSIPVALAAAIPVWRAPTGEELAWLAGIGAFGTLTHLCFNQAIKEAELTAILPLDFNRLIWASLAGYIFFAEIPGAWTWIGGAIIFASGTYLAVRERELSKEQSGEAAA
jgi:drug/metabolite transporter (DMT)-like permease